LPDAADAVPVGMVTVEVGRFGIPAMAR